MQRLIIVLFTFLISSLAGADVVKLRLNADAFRIVLTGQDAQRLQASIGSRDFTSSSSLNMISCLKPVERCEISLKDVNIQSYESIQEQVRLANDTGIAIPQISLPHNGSEQLLTARIEDSATAQRLYALLPGPEVDFNLDHSIAEEFSGKTKTLDLARNDFFMSCQQVERSSGNIKKGYTCFVNAIVPSGRN